MSDSPDALLKSALEKIVYFEARSTQLSNDLTQARGECERLHADVTAAAQREIELRRVVAELEVRVTRAHAEREEAARMSEALRRERAELIGKMLEASRIQRAGVELEDFDLAQFIAELRSEVIHNRQQPAPAGAPAPAPVAAPETPSAVHAVAASLRAEGRLTVSDAQLAELGAASVFPGRSEETLFGFSVRELSAPDVAARVRAAERLQALAHPAAAAALATALHGETHAPAQVALLGALASLAKKEAVAVVQPLLTAAHPDVRIAALKALLRLDAAQAGPHISAAMKDPESAVRRRASLLALGLRGTDALALGTQAIHDADADVRALGTLVLGASGSPDARPLLLEAMRDSDDRVRSSASEALSRALGRDVTAVASLDAPQRRREVRRLSHVPARPVTLPPRAMAPAAPAAVVTRAAAGSPRTIQASPSGSKVPHAAHVGSAQPTLHAATPRSAAVASNGVTSAQPTMHATGRHSGAVASLHGTSGSLAQQLAARRTAVAVLEPTPAVPEVAPALPPAMLSGLLTELRTAIRGRPLDELASAVGASGAEAMQALSELMQRGAVVRRGHKYFVA